MKIIRNYLALAFSILVLLVCSCKKSNDDSGESGPEEQYTPMTYPKGEASGIAIRKTIGAAGGNLSSTDGKISIIVPPGALTGNINISVQPITNTAPLGGGTAYRLLPADIEFAKQVTITLKYDDANLNGRAEESLDLVSQDDAGNWKVMNKTVADKNNAKLTVQTKKLRDFSFTGYYYLVAEKTVLGAGESTKLIVQKVSVAGSNEEDEETPLGGISTYTQSADFEKWETTGPGKVESAQSTATYTAPASISGINTAEVKATIRNIRTPRRLKGKKIVIKTRISIATDFMAGTYDGQPFTCVGVSVSSIGGVMYIQGAVGIGKSILILVNGNDLGYFAYGNPAQAGKSEIRCDLQDNKVYETHYTECGPPSVHRYTSGGMTIKAFESPGGIAAGEFTAVLYNDDDCNVKSKQITGAFRATRQ